MKKPAPQANQLKITKLTARVNKAIRKLNRLFYNTNSSNPLALSYSQPIYLINDE